MTPGQIQGTIEQIVEGLDQRRAEMILSSGTDRTSRPFKLTFDPREVEYGEMQQILEGVRARFPEWKIQGEWKQR